LLRSSQLLACMKGRKGKLCCILFAAIAVSRICGAGAFLAAVAPSPSATAARMCDIGNSPAPLGRRRTLPDQVNDGCDALLCSGEERSEVSAVAVLFAPFHSPTLFPSRVLRSLIADSRGIRQLGQEHGQRKRRRYHGLCPVFVCLCLWFAPGLVRTCCTHSCCGHLAEMVSTCCSGLR